MASRNTKIPTPSSSNAWAAREGFSALASQVQRPEASVVQVSGVGEQGEAAGPDRSNHLGDEHSGALLF
jgi:hypothetical protein